MDIAGTIEGLVREYSSICEINDSALVFMSIKTDSHRDKDDQ